MSTSDRRLDVLTTGLTARERAILAIGCWNRDEEPDERPLTHEQLIAQAHARNLYVLLKYMQRGNPFAYTEDPGRGQRWADSNKRTITIEIDGPVFDDLYFEMARWRRW